MTALSRFDLLRLPLLGAFLRWRYSRLALQLPLLCLAVIAIYDGLTGSQIAPKNTATVAVWVHYRGLVALLLLVFGNLFCAACPLMLTRGPSKLLKRALASLGLTFTWPKTLKNKYLVIALTGLFLFCYEYFDLWASPWLTAWLMIGYFLVAFGIDALFPAGSFCKYVCPLGNFNFVLAANSPTQITARDPAVCHSCAGKYCLNGRAETPNARAALLGKHAAHGWIELPMTSATAKPSNTAALGQFPGCETDLFVPAIQSNQDCTLCLNCLRACPHDNVALVVRLPSDEASSVQPKSDWALFIVLLTWAGLVNAWAMTPPFYQSAKFLATMLVTNAEAPILLLIFVGWIGLGWAVTSLVARAVGLSLRQLAPMLLPLCLAIWAGHYLYHFLTGFSTLAPNIVAALRRLGLMLPDAPRASIPARDLAFYYQVALAYLALASSCFIAWRRLRQTQRADLWLKLIPQVVLALVIVAITIIIFSLPMEARGSLLGV
jgi:polyferredoxin